MGNKTDFKKSLAQLYSPKEIGFHIVNVPPLSYIMIDGTGNPNISSDYQQAVESLYSFSYGIKFALKKHGYDHVVPPLEGLWWMDDMNEFNSANKDRWQWTMMIMQPEWVTFELVNEIKTEVVRKKKITTVLKARFETYHEGLSVQVLYTGAYIEEAQTIADMHDFIKTNGYLPNGKHHEIYLGDPRKTAPDKLQTILRQPVQKL